MDKSRGVLYAACGQRYAQEAVVSARSLKQRMPDIPCVLFTDKSEYADACFDEVQVLEEPTYSFRDKILPMMRSPFERTVFLDSDTYVAEPFYELFDVLTRFDVAASLHPWRIGPEVGCPDAFAEPSTGVIAYRQSQLVTRFLEGWLAAHDELRRERPEIGDQAAFRQLLYETNELHFYAMPTEYNFPLFCPNGIGATLPVKILHGRNIDWEDAAARLNRSDGYRVYIPALNMLNEDTVIFYTRAGVWLERLLKPVLTLARGLRGR